MTSRLASFAKINLGLEVGLKRREDRLHNVKTILVPISFHDDLEIIAATKDELSCENKIHIMGAKKNRDNHFDFLDKKNDVSSNTIWQVLLKTRSLREDFAKRLKLGKKFLKVHLRKRIPLGSGLGGASSNAGVLLKYIFESFNQALAKEDTSNTVSSKQLIKTMKKIALELGADVPFFLQKKAMLGSGIGEILSPLSLGVGLGVLALSGIHVPTAPAYAILKRPLQNNRSKKVSYVPEGWMIHALKSSNWQKLESVKNDFEDNLFSVYPELEKLKAVFLEEGAQFALLSGSGSSLYGLVDTVDEQRRLLKKMQLRFPQYYFIPFCF